MQSPGLSKEGATLGVVVNRVRITNPRGYSLCGPHVQDPLPKLGRKLQFYVDETGGVQAAVHSYDTARRVKNSRSDFFVLRTVVRENV